MFLKRLLTGVIFLVLFFASLFMERFSFVLPLIIVAIALSGVLEFYYLSKKGGCRPSFAIGVIASLIILFDGYFYQFRYIKHILILTTLAIPVVHLFRYRHMNSIADAGASIFGIVYVSLPMALALNILVSSEFGKYVIVFLVLITWSTDTGAYFIGKHLGRRKLAPRLSPNKTIEGTVGGFFVTIVCAVLLRTFWADIGQIFSVYDAVVLGILFGIFGQIGDLCESAFKRDVGAKDSGLEFTGHGGVLDIIDSLLFCIPIIYLYVPSLKLELLEKILAP